MIVHDDDLMKQWNHCTKYNAWKGAFRVGDRDATRFIASS